MLDNLPTEIVLFLFYSAFLSQIFVISIYYPGRIVRRARYVLDNFPPDTYPKFYPVRYDGLVEEEYRKLKLYKGVNYVIALIGIAVLSAMLLSGYRPKNLVGDEIFVMLYFIVQFVPMFYAELKECRQYRLMRRAFSQPTRKAQLSPRRLFDFISPGYIILAIVLYGAWIVFQWASNEFGASFKSEDYISVAVVTGMQLFFAAIIVRTLYGKMPDPYKSEEGRLRQRESKIKIAALASIGVSSFLIIAQAADRYQFEILDPVLTSLYVQIMTFFGIGLMIRMNSLSGMNFDVYKEDGSAA